MPNVPHTATQRRFAKVALRRFAEIKTNKMEEAWEEAQEIADVGLDKYSIKAINIGYNGELKKKTSNKTLFSLLN